MKAVKEFYRTAPLLFSRIAGLRPARATYNLTGKMNFRTTIFQG